MINGANAGGTMSMADIYGVPVSGFQMSDTISAGGPNQSFVAPAYSGPGTAGGAGGTAPAISVLGLILLLVAYRIVVELASRE